MLKLKLEALKHEKNLHMEEIFDWEILELNGESYPYFKPVEIVLDASFSRGRINVDGSVKTGIIHPCDRCLEPVYLEINGKIEALYLPQQKKQTYVEKSVELTELDNTFYYDPTAEFLDLEERVVEAIVIEVPIKVLCREDCKGLCPYCGINLNEHPDHVCPQKTKERSPFAVLKDKFK